MQAIGYKEFYPYYQHVKSTYGEHPASLGEADLGVLEMCKEALKRGTIQYTVYQIKWLTKRIS